MMSTYDEKLKTLIEEFPGRNKHANSVVSVQIQTASTPDARDRGYVTLRVEDKISGTVLVGVEIEPATLWQLLQGGTQNHRAFVSPHLDRVGKRMENRRVVIPRPLVDADDPDHLHRVVDMAVIAQLDEDWHENWDSHDAPRRTNRGTTEVVVRRWVEVD